MSGLDDTYTADLLYDDTDPDSYYFCKIVPDKGTNNSTTWPIILGTPDLCNLVEFNDVSGEIQNSKF